MKRLFLTIIMLGLMRLISSAQSTNDYSLQFAILKKNAVEAISAKQIKEASKRLDNFLSHMHIERSDGEGHNIIPFLSCYYEHTPLTTSAILKYGTAADTILFQKGKWYITKDLSPNMEIDLLCFEPNTDLKNKQFQRTMNNIKKEFTYNIGEELAGKNGSLFFVKDENLYYAAIESKKIPDFSILSNNGIINYASCLKAILKASNIEASYNEIIEEYLCSTIDEKFTPTDNSGTIAGSKVVTTFIPQMEVEAVSIVNELIKERFMIAIDRDGNIGLLTAIALTGEDDYLPIHIRMRMPTLAKEEQRVQMSWEDFYNRLFALVKVDIYQ